LNTTISQAEVQKLVYKFLSRYGIKFLNDDFYVGEMITAANLALTKYDPTRGRPSTMIYKYCFNRFYKILKEEKRFYERHILTQCFNDFEQKTELSPVAICSHSELAKTVQNSGLSARTKEVILLRIQNPSDTERELGAKLGISKQAVSLHIISANNYFNNNKIDFNF